MLMGYRPSLTTTEANMSEKTLAIETVFLGDDSPLLPRAVAWLRMRFAAAGKLDLSHLICALPGAHARRRFESLLQWEAAEHDMQLQPPKLVNVG